MKDETKAALPDGWRWVRLGEVCIQDRTAIEPNTPAAEERRYIGLEQIESNSGRVLSTTEGESEVNGMTFAFDNRHVLYNKLRPYLNKVAIPNFIGRCSTELIPLLPNQSIIKTYLAHILRREETVDAMMREKTGSRMPRADMGRLLELEFALPSLKEQEHIVKILQNQLAALEEARAAAEAQLETLKLLPAALLRAAFNGTMDLTVSSPTFPPSHLPTFPPSHLPTL